MFCYHVSMKKTFLVTVVAVFCFTTSANACLAACKEKKRDEVYSKPLSAATLQSVIEKSMPKKAVDQELGEPFQVYPIEVKAEENLRSKSLKLTYDENKSLRPVRFSMADYREQEWMVNIPLYLVSEWFESAE